MDTLSFHSKLTNPYWDWRLQTFWTAKVRAVQQSIVKKCETVEIKVCRKGFDQDN